MSAQRMVCRHCGGEDFHADVTVNGTGWVDSTGVFVGDDGEPHFEADGRAQDFDENYYDIDDIVCADCGKRVPERKLTDLVRVQQDALKVGDKVTMPDGFDAVVEAVGPDREVKGMYGPGKVLKGTVIIGGREFFAHECVLVEPNPDQLDLLDAA